MAMSNWLYYGETIVYLVQNTVGINLREYVVSAQIMVEHYCKIFVYFSVLHTNDAEALF